MYENNEGDMVSKMISTHLAQKGNLSPAEIQSKALDENITISLPALKKRIDEFKKSQSYINFTKTNSSS